MGSFILVISLIILVATPITFIVFLIKKKYKKMFLSLIGIPAFFILALLGGALLPPRENVDTVDVVKKAEEPLETIANKELKTEVSPKEAETVPKNIESSSDLAVNKDESSSLTNLIEVYMNIEPVVKDGKLGFFVETNLPDSTKLSSSLKSNDFKANSGNLEIIDGKISFESFSNKGKSLPDGNYELTIYVLTPSQQNKDIQSILGDGFQNLAGDLVHNENGISIEKTIPITIKNETPTINYEIKAVDDTSIGPIIRKSLRIFVSNPQDLTQESFEKLCQNVVKEYTSTTPVNALTLYFFDNERDISSGYTLGMCTYYPNGDIGEAMNVQTGDYSNFEYKYTFEKKDTAEMPTDKEFEIYDYFMDLLIKTDGSEEAESECTKKTAEKFNISIEEVDNIFIKVSAYKLS